MKDELQTLFIGVNILNILDKALTWLALQNPDISELSPIVRSIVGKLGLVSAMILYTLVGFVILYAVYRVVIMKRLLCEKNNMSPEAIFLMLNVIFFFIVVNNTFWAFYKA